MLSKASLNSIVKNGCPIFKSAPIPILINFKDVAEPSGEQYVIDWSCALLPDFTMNTFNGFSLILTIRLAILVLFPSNQSLFSRMLYWKYQENDSYLRSIPPPVVQTKIFK